MLQPVQGFMDAGHLKSDVTWVRLQARQAGVCQGGAQGRQSGQGPGQPAWGPPGGSGICE